MRTREVMAQLATDEGWPIDAWLNADGVAVVARRRSECLGATLAPPLSRRYPHCQREIAHSVLGVAAHAAAARWVRRCVEVSIFSRIAANKELKRKRAAADAPRRSREESRRNKLQVRAACVWQ